MASTLLGAMVVAVAHAEFGEDAASLLQVGRHAALQKHAATDTENATLACVEALTGTNPTNTGYRGCQDTTRSGKTCQRWTAQSPNTHDRTAANYPNAGLGDHNYCRNPDWGDTIWCYTINGPRWEYCDAKTQGAHFARWARTMAGTTSYSQAQEYCARNHHSRLCTRADICPHGHAGKEMPVGGWASGDSWVPVGDEDNQWVQTGNGYWPSCQLHSEVDGGKHGKPSWGPTQTSLHFRHDVCCAMETVGGETPNYASDEWSGGG